MDVMAVPTAASSLLALSAELVDLLLSRTRVGRLSCDLPDLLLTVGQRGGRGGLVTLALLLLLCFEPDDGGVDSLGDLVVAELIVFTLEHSGLDELCDNLGQEPAWLELGHSVTLLIKPVRGEQERESMTRSSWCHPWE